MKQTIKYLILALLIPAAYCFTACDTDIEPIDQQIIKPDQQDPAQYAAYLAALKAYKASEHYVVYASLANAPAVPGSEKAFLRSLPDSLDIVALENAGNLTEYDIEEYRRTGYPKLMPAKDNKSGGTVNSKYGMRRLPYPSEEYSENRTNVEAAITSLGGPDNGGTRTWWDCKPLN